MYKYIFTQFMIRYTKFEENIITNKPMFIILKTMGDKLSDVANDELEVGTIVIRNNYSAIINLSIIFYKYVTH